MKNIFIALCSAALLYSCCVASETDYDLAKKQERLTAEFWQADNGHYSGEEK
jgi:hypothetical protein